MSGKPEAIKTPEEALEALYSARAATQLSKLCTKTLLTAIQLSRQTAAFCAAWRSSEYEEHEESASYCPVNIQQSSLTHRRTLALR
ncbi:MAG: hypothetical protein MHM6MM_007109 [Cercozoa sp. M6MM]